MVAKQRLFVECLANRFASWRHHPDPSIEEIIRNPKHPFRKADDRPVKAQKHRYERRKVKEYIRLGDWVEGNTA